jgi:hypothetical protein
LRFFLLHLLQQAEPSDGCAQQAPPLSSVVSLGVQQTEAFLAGLQHEEAGVFSIFSIMILLFFSKGISIWVSI